MTVCAYSVHGLLECRSVLQCVVVCCSVKKLKKINSQNVWARIHSEVINELILELIETAQHGFKKPRGVWFLKT